MKKSILILATALFAVVSFAQTTKKTPEEIATKRSEKLKTELGLSDDQKTKVHTAIVETVTKVREIKAKYPNDKKAAAKEIKVVRENYKTTMKGILTADQFTKWETSVKNKKDKVKAKKKAKKEAEQKTEETDEDEEGL